MYVRTFKPSRAAQPVINWSFLFARKNSPFKGWGQKEAENFRTKKGPKEDKQGSKPLQAFPARRGHREERSLLGSGLLSGLPYGSDCKKSACSVGDPGSISGSGRSPREGNGNPCQYSCLENPMDRGAWLATVHRVSKSNTIEATLCAHRPWNKFFPGLDISLICYFLSFLESFLERRG